MKNARIVYWSEDDGGLYAPAYLEEAKPDGSNDVPGFTRYKVPKVITLRSDEFDGRSDLIDILLSADPPLAEGV